MFSIYAGKWLEVIVLESGSSPGGGALCNLGGKRCVVLLGLLGRTRLR